MIYELAKFNVDIKQLLEKGYALSIDSNFLIVRDIYYLNEQKELQNGSFVSKIEFIDNDRIKLHDHQMMFCGTHPCQIDGSQIMNLGGGPATLTLVSKDLKVQRNFSHKPVNGYINFFDKIETYTQIISGPAIELFGDAANPWTFRAIENVEESVFKYRDTLTSRAEIGDLSEMFKNEIVAIIGLGGTGSYILDFLVKTPIKEIRGFDNDVYHVHNSFRSPGQMQKEELGQRKADIYQNRYDGFRHGLKFKSMKILSDSEDELRGVTFAFVCVDKGESRKGVIELLIKFGIPFIDVGMGLDRKSDSINGMIRVVYFSKEESQATLDKNIVPTSDPEDDIYRNNIQISELNALNACLAVIKYKKLIGFYSENDTFYYLLSNLESLKVMTE